MSLLFVAYFTEYGEPKTSLSPTIRIRDLSDNSLVVTDQAMTEVGDGFYKYTYADADNAKNYVGRAYGGASQPNGEKYIPCISEVAGTANAILEDTGTTLPGLINGLHDLSSNDVKAAIGDIMNLSDGKVDVGKINGVSVDGAGSEADPWGPV